MNAIIAVACIIALIVLLAIGAAKGFTIAQVWRISWGGNRRFWAGQRDWWRHGDEDRDGGDP